MPTLDGKWRRFILAIAVASAFGGGLWLATSSRGSAAQLGPSYGVSLELPSGWTGRIYNASQGTGRSLADLQAGSFQAADDEDLVKDAARAAEVMEPSDALILLWEAGGSVSRSDYEQLLGPPQIGTDDVRVQLEGFPSTHAVGQLFFTTKGRRFDLMVEFGSLSPDSAQLHRVNRVLETLAIEPASRADSGSVHAKEFARAQDPPLRLTIPPGWLTNAAWMNLNTSPEPIVAVQNREFSLAGDRANPLIPNELDLPRDGVALTVTAVRLHHGERYMPATASADTFSAADAPLSPTHVGGVSSVFAWVVRRDIRWGYLVYGWVGPDAGSDAALMTPLLNSIRFSA
jgi:hypothetical protein